MSDHIDEFIQYLAQVRGLSNHTTRAYRADLVHVVNWCARAELDVHTLTHRHLRRYLGELDAAQYERSTIARKMATLRAYYDYLVEHAIIEDNPAQLLSIPKKGKTLPKVLSAPEIKAILDSPDPATPLGLRDAALLEFLYATGARVAEVASLDLGNVDVRAGSVRLHGKGEKERLVFLHHLAVAKLNDYLENGRGALSCGRALDAVFLSSRGNRLSTDAIRRIVQSHATQAGIASSVNPHRFRHTFASDLLAAGADLRSVQELLGHANLSTTQIYTQVNPTRLKQVYEQTHPRA